MEYSRKYSTVFLLVILVLVVGITAGCGGGDQGSESQNGGNNGDAAQNESGASQGQGGETAQEQGGGATGQAEGSRPEIKIALGDIVSVDTEARRVVLKPVQGERQVFRVVPNANVTVDDVPAELADLEQGQQAQIRYITRNDRERARAVNAFTASEGSG